MVTVCVIIYILLFLFFLLPSNYWKNDITLTHIHNTLSGQIFVFGSVNTHISNDSPITHTQANTKCLANPKELKSLPFSLWMSALSYYLPFAYLAGVATYMCVAHLGHWDTQGPDLSNCTSPWVNHIMQKVSLKATPRPRGSYQASV